MNKYINLDLIDKDFTDQLFRKYPASYSPGILAAIEEVKQLPVANVRKIVFGKWIKLPNGWDGIDEYQRFECSNCHREVFSNFPFCPYCTANMVEE